jgi:hypothetical protein
VARQAPAAGREVGGNLRRGGAAPKRFLVILSFSTFSSICACEEER